MSTRRERRRATLLAPAKVNLALRVVGRRDDGYHDIDSIFVPVGVHDEVEIEWSPGAAAVELACDDPALPRGAGNIAWQAAETFLEASRARGRVRVSLRKRIPAGAGLGGGSSDAAAVLRLLAHIAGDPPGAPLAALAKRLGADVPFFLECRPARVRGIGDVIEPLADFRPLWLAIVFPGFPVVTRWAYERLDQSLTARGAVDTIRGFGAVGGKVDYGSNDFEEVVGERYPSIVELKHALLEAGAASAGLSGSGSAVFGVFEDERAARRAAREQRGSWTAVARSLDGPAAVVEQ